MELRDRIITFLHLSNIFVDPFSVFEEPIRYEVFSPERLELHAERLAGKQKIIANPHKGRRLKPRIRENVRVLRASYHAIRGWVQEQKRVTPAAEWLLDNFQIVNEQLRIIRNDLPACYYRELPKLAGGPFNALPRVYELIWSYVAHTDSLFNPEVLTRFIRAYQRMQPLTIGELWAVPVTLRIVLVENLRRIAVRMVAAQRSRTEADRLADQLLENTGESRHTALGTLRMMVVNPPSMAFTVQLVKRLRSQGAEQADAVHWLQESLSAQGGATPGELVLMEHGLQALANVTVRNIISSMRLISGYGGDLFSEAARLTDKVRQTELLPATKDPISRIRYRQGLEELIKRVRFNEPAVADRVNAKLDQLHTPGSFGTCKVYEAVPPVVRRFHTANQRFPATHLLSNGRYAVMITAAGSGYSRWKQFAVTRWGGKISQEPFGSYVFLRDTKSGSIWSAAQQPTGVEAKRYQVIFTEDRARIVRYDDTTTTTMEIILSQEDDVELRRISIFNDGSTTREIEVTSYAEVVLAQHNLDTADPALPNFFVHTEYRHEAQGLLAGRRPRSADEIPVWAAHLVGVQGKLLGNIEYETDRMRFLGRGNTIRRPLSVTEGYPLSNMAGHVLDPIFSLRVKVRIEPGSTAHITFSTMVAASRNEVILLADKYRQSSAYERTSTHAWSHTQIMLNYLGMGRGEAHLFQHLANRLLYSDASRGPKFELLQLDGLNVTPLWKQGITGDYPIVLVRVDGLEDHGIVRQLLLAHEYWRMKLLDVDLVILNEKDGADFQDLQRSLEGMVEINLAVGRALPESGGRIFVLRSDVLTAEEINLLHSASRAVLTAHEGSLAEQLMRMRRQEHRLFSRIALDGAAMSEAEKVLPLMDDDSKHVVSLTMRHPQTT